MSFITNTLLSLHGGVALLAIFIFPALESSVFLGFIFPGETAVILGGVLAYEHRIPLAAAMAVAMAGAIIGDSVGYWVGREFGARILDSRSGRLIKKEHVRTAEDFIAKRGGVGVFLGRFAAALRAIVPGLAGMSHMRYRTFVIFNVLGGVAWAVAFTVAGYLAGASFRTVESVSGKAGYALAALLALIVVGVILVRRRKSARNQPALAIDMPADTTMEANRAEEP
ncbi:MAG: DedA family protein [Actinomycetota bacterium]|nr:DedA family protein [Actinomycetota bacterium]